VALLCWFRSESTAQGIRSCDEVDADAGGFNAELRAFKLDVVRIERGAIAEITTFGAGLFPALPRADALRTKAATTSVCVHQRARRAAG
jgi:hypothetical protein